ncbi:transcriptional regulator [Phytohabitans flavus]
MIASIAQGLHLSLDERDHLFRLAGHNPPTRGSTSEHISPGLLRIFDRLTDSPAEIVTELGETLRQTPLGVALTGDLTRYTGPARSIAYRWFTDPASRTLYHPDDHERISRVFASGARKIATLRGPGSRAAGIANLLLDQSPEFASLWSEHEVGVGFDHAKRFVHPELGVLELTCQALLDPDQSHTLLVFTAVPGSESYEKLQLLSVIGTQRITQRSSPNA